MQIQDIQIPGMEDNVISSDFHTLITENMPEQRYPIFEEDGTPIEDVYEIVPEYTKHRLFIGDFVDESYHGWNKIKDRLMNADSNDFLEVHISSNGGYSSEGIELYNIINTKFSSAQVYLNYAYSMGALTFLFFGERTIYEHSEIMFHNWSGGFGGKASDIEDHFIHTKNYLRNFFKKILKPYFSKKEIKKILNGKETWLDSYEMLERGIATGIIKDGEYYTTEDYLNKYKKNGKLKKSYKKQIKKQLKETEETNENSEDAENSKPY
jgi:ATP-dependent protease ClpP protease subunit